MLQHSRRGFTLIEVLVVVAVIATLVGILLPALGKARASAWRSVSSSTQRQFHTALAMYGQSNDEFVPGAATSGLEIFAMTKPEALAKANNDVNQPTSPFDWLSPILDESLPVDRDGRMWYIFENFADPALRDRASVFSGGDFGTPEALAYGDSKGEQWPAASYLMPDVWQFYPNKPGLIVPGQEITQLPYYDDNKVIKLPGGFSPRTTKFGNLAGKIAIADGVRAHTGQRIEFDASIAPNPGQRDPWTSRGAIFNRSVSYGVGKTYDASEPSNDSDGVQIPLSYRHENQLDAAHWDGHVELYSIDETHNPSLWYPSRSTWVGTDAIGAAKAALSPGDKLP